MRVADAFKEARIAAGLTQRQVAELLGISPQFVNDLEHGKRSIGEKYLSKMPDAMRVFVSVAMIEEHKLAIDRIEGGQ